MFGYIVRRVFQGILVLWAISMITFALFFYGPSNPAQAMCPATRCTPEKLDEITTNLGLDRPVVTQYTEYMTGIFTGREIGQGEIKQDCPAPCFGYSFKYSVNVYDYLKALFPASISVALGSAVIFLALGLTVGIVAARNRGRSVDPLTVGSTLVLSSIPFYLVCLLSLLIVHQKWGLFPDPGYFSPFTDGPVAWIKGMLLAWVGFGIYNATQYARYSRGSMLDTLNEDYVRTARAKGLSERAVSLKHALRAAIVPIVTIFGLDLAALLSGTIFIESILSIHGTGWATLQALKAQDLPVIQAATLLGCALIVIGNLVTDIMYSVVDPRVRLA